MGVTRVALLDAGAQLEKVIMRRVLEQGYECHKFPVNVDPSEIKDYDAVIISGGPRSVNDADALLPHPDIYKLNKPILGICYGLQAIAHQLGGKVSIGARGQYGRSYVNISRENSLFSGLSEKERVLMSHFDAVEKVPEGFEVYGTSEGVVAVIGDEKRRIYATQFHPELIPVTKNGNKIFENFFRKICKFPEAQKRTIREEIENAKKIIIETVNSDKVVMHYLSGGVDSTVMALLLKECIEPDRLYMRTLNTGTMRLIEIEEVKAMAKEFALPNFEVLNVAAIFYSAEGEIEANGIGKLFTGPLYDIIEPEYKRKLFGLAYASVALEEMNAIAEEKGISLEQMLLGQGTLRPDVIESGDRRVTKGEAHTIKTHHNAAEALMNISKLEPLIELFKDQVRQIALHYGLPEAFAFRQPFPGPGLYCRMIGSEGFTADDEFLKLDKKVEEAAKKQGFNAHVLPVKTVGVQGDERSYKHPVIVSGKEIDWNEFAKLALDLPNEMREINRVLYTTGNPLTFEQAVGITPTLMDHEAINQAQHCDMIMRHIAETYGYNDSRKCSQMPGILIPSNFGESGKRSFVIRPVWTHDFMAVIGMIPYSGSVPEESPEECFPEEMFLKMAEEIKSRSNDIARVILDPSDKPPASTEWE